jgi:hypothetical protein
MLLCSMRKYGLTTKFTKDTKGRPRLLNFVLFVSFVVSKNITTAQIVHKKTRKTSIEGESLWIP